MTEAFALIVFILIAVFVFALLAQPTAADDSETKTDVAHPVESPSLSLPNHDLSERRATNTSSRWSYHYACVNCFERMTSAEFRTKICLSCGHESEWLAPSSAWRKVLHNGRWTDHARIHNKDYLRIDGVMTPVNRDGSPVRAVRTEGRCG